MPDLISPPASPIAPVAVHPYDERLRITAASIRRDRTRSADNGAIPVYLSNAREDRHGSTIRPDAWKKRLGTFLANPVMQWAHISWIPAVGNALNLTDDGNGWVANLKFATDAWSNFGGANFARLLEDLMNDDMLHAVSPGFMPHAFVARQAKDMPQFLDPENVEYTEVELLEISPCNVPSNREALQKSLQRGSVSSNGLDALIQLGVLPRIFDDAPIALLSRSVATPTEERSMPTAASFRAQIADVVKRCCGCDSYREPQPEAITEEEKAADLASITALITAQLATFEAAVAAWKSTSQPNLRTSFSNIATSAMYSIEWLIYRAKEWYDEDIDITVPDITDADMDAIASSADVLTRSVVESPSSGRVATLRSLVKSSREALRDYWIDAPCGSMLVVCCPICYTPESEGCDCGKTLSAEAAAAEQTSITAMIGSYSRLLSVGLAGWDSAEHDALRDNCRASVMDALYTIDRLLDFQDFWYPEMAAGNVATVDAVRMRKFVASDHARTGAEFSAKNKKIIASAHAHASEIVRMFDPLVNDLGDATDADNPDDQPGTARNIRVVQGSSSSGREEVAGQMIRIVSAADAPGAGSGERSTHQAQPDLYSAATLRVKRQ